VGRGERKETAGGVHVRKGTRKYGKIDQNIPRMRKGVFEKKKIHVSLTARKKQESPYRSETSVTVQGEGRTRRDKKGNKRFCATSCIALTETLAGARGANNCCAKKRSIRQTLSTQGEKRGGTKVNSGVGKHDPSY